MRRVPDTATRIKISTDGRSVVTSDTEFVINPYEEYALEQGVQLKEKHGGEVTVLTLGPEKSTSVILKALALGADNAIHLKSENFPDDPSAIARALAAELKTVEFPANGVPSIQKLDSLPYLDAVIKEGLRLFAAIPMTLFREVPAEGKVMSGYTVPGGTIVGSQAYSLHRNEEIYPNPEEFTPERWLNVDKETELQMQRQFWAFSSGARSCIGQKYSPLINGQLLIIAWRWLR